MPYHYEIRFPYHVPDGPDDYATEVEIAKFPAMIDAINFGRRFPGSALFMVLEDMENPALDDEIELPLNLA